MIKFSKALKKIIKPPWKEKTIPLPSAQEIIESNSMTIQLLRKSINAHNLEKNPSPQHTNQTRVMIAHADGLEDRNKKLLEQLKQN